MPCVGWPPGAARAPQRRERPSAGSGRWTSQKFGDRRNKCVRGLKLDYPASLAKSIDKVLKIFHVRPGHHRLSGQDWFDRVLTAYATKAFPYNDDARRGVPFPQFSGGVNDQDSSDRAQNSGWSEV